MLKRLVFCLSICATSSTAESALVDASLDQHILPKVAAFSESAATLAETTIAHCSEKSPELRAAFGRAFDDWIAISHLRFGPIETDERGFAIAFWPDTKGFTPKALNQLIAESDPSIYDPEAFATVSVAARGFYGLEFLLFDPGFAQQDTAEFRCDLIRAISTEIFRNARGIAMDWQLYHGALREPSDRGQYKSDEEALREVFKALLTGLQFTADARLGRPLGTFERPRPRRAEARRSQRSLRHITISLEATYELAMLLSETEPEIRHSLVLAFDRALELAKDLEDPSFANIADPTSRFRVKVLQDAVNRIQDIAILELAPALGVSAGFNALDGD